MCNIKSFLNVILIFIFTANQSTNALECYTCIGNTLSCNEYKAQKCSLQSIKNNDRTLTFIPPLESNSTLPKDETNGFACAKASYTSGNEKGITRGCTMQNYCTIIPASIKLQECTLCYDNLCNGAGSIQSWTFIALTTATIIKLCFT